ncbi:hypothetical protein TWF281_004637 [Arthrobotrys megalospora]
MHLLELPFRSKRPDTSLSRPAVVPSPAEQLMTLAPIQGYVGGLGSFRPTCGLNLANPDESKVRPMFELPHSKLGFT